MCNRKRLDARIHFIGIAVFITFNNMVQRSFAIAAIRIKDPCGEQLACGSNQALNAPIKNIHVCTVLQKRLNARGVSPTGSPVQRRCSVSAQIVTISRVTTLTNHFIKANLARAEISAPALESASMQFAWPAPAAQWTADQPRLLVMRICRNKMQQLHQKA